MARIPDIDMSIFVTRLPDFEHGRRFSAYFRIKRVGYGFDGYGSTRMMWIYADMLDKNFNVVEPDLRLSQWDSRRAYKIAAENIGVVVAAEILCKRVNRGREHLNWELDAIEVIDCDENRADRNNSALTLRAGAGAAMAFEQQPTFEAAAFVRLIAALEKTTEEEAIARIEATRIQMAETSA